MLSLAELQSTMRDVSLGGDAERLAGVIVEDGFSHAERLNIHRNNTTILLCEALSATFSVVNKLVGDEFFEAVTRLFVRAQPPRSPCLFEYGATFPTYLATLPAAADLPYLGDVARLEWLWNEAFHAPEATPLTSADLADVKPEAYGDLTFGPHPSLGLLGSPYPIKEIWDINQCDAAPDATVNLDEGGQALAVLRPKTNVEILELSPCGFVLAGRLRDGARLEEAFSAAQSIDPAFDPASTLAVLISAGAFKSYNLKS